MVFMPRRVLNGGSLDGILITWDHGRHRDEVEVIEVVVQVEAKEEGGRVCERPEYEYTAHVDMEYFLG